MSKQLYSPSPTDEELAFKAALEADLLGEATDEQLKLLEGDTQLWRDRLSQIVSDINLDINKRKVPKNDPAYEEYRVWRIRALDKQSHVISRLRDVRAMQSEQQSSDGKMGELLKEQKETNAILREMLAVLRGDAI